MWRKDGDIITQEPNGENLWKDYDTDPCGVRRLGGGIYVHGVIPVCHDIGGMSCGRVPSTVKQPDQAL